MPYTPDQIAKLKATDPIIVRQALERMSDAERAELLTALQGSAPSALQMQPSHTPYREMLPSHVPYAPPESVQATAPEPETTPEGLLGAVNRGLLPYATAAGLGALAGAPAGGVGAIPGAAAGVAAMGLTKLAMDPVTAGINEIFGTKYSMPSDALEDLMTRIGVPEPKTEAERIVKSLAETAAGAGSQAALGQTLMRTGFSPLAQGVGRQLASQPVSQIVGGAGAGAASQAVAEQGGGVIPQIGAGLVGGMAGAKLASPRGARIQQTAKMADIAEAERAGIPVMTSDVKPPQSFASKWVQSMGEKIPYAGTGGPRAVQQSKRVGAVKAILEDYGVLPGFSPEDASKASADVFHDLVGKRSAQLKKYAGMKSEVIKRLDESGSVPMPKTISALDAEVERLKSLKSQDASRIVDVLNDWKISIEGQNLSNIESLRSQIGESFKGSGLEGVRTMAEKSLSGIYKHVRDDMGDYIKTNGQRQDYTKWMIANKRLSEMAGEVETGVMRSVLKSGKLAPEDINKMLFSSKPSEVRRLVEGLTPEGRKNAKMAVMARVAEQSGGVENISPEKFVSAVKKTGASIGAIFEGDELDRVKALARVLKLTGRASQASLAPQTGVQAVPIIGAAVLTDLLGGSGAVLATMATVGGLARVYESAPIRNLLLQIERSKPGSREEAYLVKRFTTAIQGQNATEQENQ